MSRLGEREHIGRGVARALLMVPVGIAAWLVVRNLGFISGWIALVVALGMLALYRSGARRLSGVGATIVILLAGVTIATALLAGFAWNVAAAIMSLANVDALTALGDPAFVPLLVTSLAGPGLVDVIASVVAGALGIVAVVVSAIQDARRTAPAIPVAPAAPLPAAPLPAAPLATASPSVPGPWDAPATAAPAPWDAPSATPAAAAAGIDWVLPSGPTPPADPDARAVAPLAHLALEPAPLTAAPEPAPSPPAPWRAAAPETPAPAAVAATAARATTGSVPRPPVTRVVTRALEAGPAAVAAAG